MDLGAIVAELKRSTDTFGPLVRAQAERIPDRVALKFESEQLTYGAYDREVNRLVAALAREGVGPGTPVAIFARNSPRFLVALGAVAKLGAIGALVNTHVTGAGLTHVLRVSQARLGVCDAAALPALDAVAGTHPVAFLADAAPGEPLPAGVRPLGDVLPATAPEPAIPEIRGGDVFLYIYTSGTTGYPKATIVRHLRFTMARASSSGSRPPSARAAPSPRAGASARARSWRTCGATRRSPSSTWASSAATCSASRPRRATATTGCAS